MTRVAIKQDLQAEFDRVAAEVLAPLARRHGLSCRLAHGGLLVMESARCRVRVRFGTGHEPDLSVTLAPPSATPVEDDLDRQQIGLGLYLEHLSDPRLAWESRVLRSEDDVRAELERAEAALAHASPVLAGDFSAWPALQARAVEWARELKHSMRAGTAGFRTWRARQEARTAYGRGDLSQAASLYESIGDELTPDERARLEYARRHA